MYTLRCAALCVLFICYLSFHCQIAQCQSTQSTNANNHQAVSPPPSFLEWLQPFRPIITVSKFPPIIEFIAHRIQTQLSNYIYEDLSRPQTYDRPTYKPYVSTDSTPSTLTPSEDVPSTTEPTEPLIIPTVAPPKLVLVDLYDLTTSPNFNQSIQIEYQLRNVVKLNKSNEGTNKTELESNVRSIMQRNHLTENVTHVFEIQQVDHDYKDEKPFTYKDVSNFFANNVNVNDEDEFVKYLQRGGSMFKKVPKRLIALTKIRHHVYVNVINVRNQQKT